MPRRLGQHFLKAASVERLLRVVDPRPDEHFLEIGPGAGALTLPLAARAGSRDRGRAGRAGWPRRCARTRRPTSASSTATRSASTSRRSSRAAAASSATCRTTSRARCSGASSSCARDVRDVHVMLQEEVARRIASPPGSKDYGILSVLYGLWADVDIPLRFPPGAFAPPPEGRSALLRDPLPARAAGRGRRPRAFERLVFQAFARRRRTLENNLQDSYPNLKEHLRLLKIKGTRRAETLSVVEFASLSKALG